ncbi:MAG: hypothetical protein U1C53_01305 [Candidatus Veblenbacteria bacterium]|nr:hypothetical protein [Candidatus Veblenbacteria bacterium]
MIALVYIAVGIVLWFLRQTVVPYLGGIADVFIVIPSCLVWLRRSQRLAWLMLLVGGLFMDFLVVRLLPTYTLATISSLAILYLVIVRYLSSTTPLGSLVMLLAWIVVWRACYLVWLAAGWFGGDATPHFGLPTLWLELIWLAAGLGLAGVGWLFMRVGERAWVRLRR